jgi:23S rRNA pseudouridine2604 synthase
MRLNKFISDSGICSRREADRLIEQGKVYINGRKAKIGDQVAPGDKVNANGQLLQEKDAEDFIFIAFNKPVGITSTTEMSDKTNIIDYVNHTQRIFPIGRLDKDSQGLIFLTNNGDIVNKILRAGNKHEKEYLVTVNKPITTKFIEDMGNGVPILGETTKKCAVTQESPFIFRIVLIQGLNRQIRRMCEHFGYEVTKLERVRIMNIRLKGLPVGDWRNLDDTEIESIFKMLEHSKSEEPARQKGSAKQAKSPGPRAFHKNNSGTTQNSSRSEKSANNVGIRIKSAEKKIAGAKPEWTGKKAAVAGKKPDGIAKKFESAFKTATDKNVAGNKTTRRSSDWQKQEIPGKKPASGGAKGGKFAATKPAGSKPSAFKQTGKAKGQFSSIAKPSAGRAGKPRKK